MAAGRLSVSALHASYMNDNQKMVDMCDELAGAPNALTAIVATIRRLQSQNAVDTSNANQMKNLVDSIPMTGTQNFFDVFNQVDLFNGHNIAGSNPFKPNISSTAYTYDETQAALDAIFHDGRFMNP